MSRKILCIIAAAVALGGCGSSASGGTSGRPVVYAASSLRDALPALLPHATYSFAGSNQLRTQIEQGAPADVFIGASPKDPQALAAAGRCTTPIPVATNELVIITPPHGSASLGSLARGGARIAVGASGVPIGDYTRKLLRSAGDATVLTRNTVSSEPNVASIVAKVRLGSADAGFVYISDAKAAQGAVRTVRLPASAQPTVRYEACVLDHGGAAARRYLASLLSSAVQDGLVARGFGRAR